MKCSALALFGLFAVAPSLTSAQEIVPIGNVAHIDDNAATTWAMSGYEIFRVSRSDGDDTPITRTLKYDARTVEILSRAQTPPLTGDDVRTMMKNGRYYVIVRRYLLAEVKPQDASAEGTTQAALAAKWAASVRRVLPQVAPLPSRFGI